MLHIISQAHLDFSVDGSRVLVLFLFLLLFVVDALPLQRLPGAVGSCQLRQRGRELSDGVMATVSIPVVTYNLE